jgi:hypothetical protein
MTSAGLLAIRGALASCLCAAGLGAQSASQLRGRVLDGAGRPLAGATVTLTSIGYAVRTDSTGTFLLNGTPGSTLALSITAGGYRADTATIVLPRSGAIAREFVLVSSNAPLPVANPSDRVLAGAVTDTEGTPLAYATIQVNGGRPFVSDDTGRFRIPVDVSGSFSLLVRRIGYSRTQLKLAAMPDTAVHVRMEALATPLPETRVTARSPFASLDIHGFYRRMQDVEKGINRGYFVTPEDLEQRRPTLVTSAVEHLPNVRVRLPTAGSYPRNPNARANRENGPPSQWTRRIEDGQGCPMTVYLDRVKIQPYNRGGQITDEFIDAVIQPTTVAAIEVYPTQLGSPPEFPPAAFTCGVVLLWTK